METKKIYITEKDLGRLRDLVRENFSAKEKQVIYLRQLAEELRKAEAVAPEEVPRGVVTMNSTVKLKDLDTKDIFVYTLVYPEFSDPDQGKISILAPVGTALIGYQEGDVVEWPVPYGVRHLKIEQVLYQPEAAGKFDR